MGAFSYYDSSIGGDVYIQRLSAYVRRNEEALANGLLCFSKNRSNNVTKPMRLSMTVHHLYYITERIESSSLGVDIGPLNIKLDNPNHEPTFISFMANNARSSKQFESDTKSISSINSMKSIVSSASVYWRSFALSKDPKTVHRDIKYLYSSFTKIPCLILSPNTKINSISGYEEYPCDTSVPIKMFKNLQVLEIIDYDPNEIFGWNTLSEQLRILIIKNSKTCSVEEILFDLVIDDESGRSSFNSHRHARRSGEFTDDHFKTDNDPQNKNNAFKYSRRERALTTGASSYSKDMILGEDFVSSSDSRVQGLSDSKWSFLKQLTISNGSITKIPSFVFKPLNNLVKLNLSNNLLEDLPDGLEQLVNIKYLNFADNYITNLKKLPTDLKHLSTLNFNNNKLTNLDGLENLYVLEKIDLRRNELKDIKGLRPIVKLFMKNPDKLDNVYISGNKLPKNYRIDLFNLFNGIKYKNHVKIDDSRPGYFESALLLDSEGAFKYLEKIFGEKKSEVRSDTEYIIHSLQKTKLHSNQNNSNEDGSLLAGRNSPRTTSSSSIHSNFTMQKLSIAPLTPNKNVANTNSLSVLKPRLALVLPFESPTTSVPFNGNMKRSTTLTKLDLDPKVVNNTAPSILTTVQVTARMST